MNSLKLGSPLGGSCREISTNAPVCWFMALTFSPPGRDRGSGAVMGSVYLGTPRDLLLKQPRSLTSANDQPTLVRWDGEGHLPTWGAPVALPSSSSSAPRGHPWARGAWWAALQDEQETGHQKGVTRGRGHHIQGPLIFTDWYSPGHRAEGLLGHTGITGENLDWLALVEALIVLPGISLASASQTPCTCYT